MTTTFTDFRVMYQYNNPPTAADSELVRPASGPRFEFTTILARTSEEAASEIRTIHSNDQNFEIVQVVEANHYVTGFPE